MQLLPLVLYLIFYMIVKYCLTISTRRKSFLSNCNVLVIVCSSLSFYIYYNILLVSVCAFCIRLVPARHVHIRKKLIKR